MVRITLWGYISNDTIHDNGYMYMTRVMYVPYHPICVYRVHELTVRACTANLVGICNSKPTKCR